MGSASGKKAVPMESDTPLITKVQADLIFKKQTGFSRVSLPGLPTVGSGSAAYGSNQGFSSFSASKEKQAHREQVHGLNRMDFDTFVIVLTEISQMMYPRFFSPVNKTWIERGLSTSLLTLVQ